MGKTRRKATHRQDWIDYELAHPCWWCEPPTGKKLSRKYNHRDGIGKPPGWEIWSRRPGQDKEETVRLERRYGKRDTRKAAEDDSHADA